MDARLLAWARAVKQRRHSKLPILWLFTDAERLPNPLPAIAKLPKSLSGVVFRHDDVPRRAELAKRVAVLCRARQIPLVIAGDARLAASLGSGMHLRLGIWPSPIRSRRLVTSSAHNIAEIRRAQRTGADIIFLSPIFKTASHPDQPSFGAVRWANIAQRVDNKKLYSLGGINGSNILSLPHFCDGIGAISALGC